MKKRLIRLAIAFFLPAILGAILFVSLINVQMLIEGKFLLLSIIYGYMFGGIQSLLYALLVEFLLIPSVQNVFHFVLFSSTLGSLAGLSINLILSGLDTSTLVFITIGGLVGLVLGSILFTIRD